MDRIRKHDWRSGVVTAGTEGLILAVPLPPGTILNNVRGDFHIIGVGTQAADDMVAYGLHLWLIPIDDPDAAANYNTMKNKHVLKPSTLDTVDLDEGTEDTNPFFSPGEYDMEGLYGVSKGPQQVYGREILMSVASHGGMNFALDTSVDWFPMDHFKVKVGSRYRIDEFMFLAVVLSVPDWGALETGLGEGNSLIEIQWYYLQYISMMMELAFVDSIGLTVSDPFDDVNDWLADFLVEARAATANPVFTATQWTYGSKWMTDFSVEGEWSNKGQVSAASR